MKKKLLIIGGVIVLLLGGLIIAPNLIDWNAYKPQVASAVEAATGKTVRFDGDLSFKLLPSPALRAKKISLPNWEGGTAENFIEMEALDIRLELFPLFSGNVKVTTLVVDGGNIYLEVNRDGKSNWETLFASEPAEEPAEESKEVAINSFKLSETNIYYRNAQTALEDEVLDINADLILTSLEGPFTGDGDFTYKGIPIDFTFATGRFNEGANIPLRLGLMPGGDDPGLNFQGTLVQEAGVSALSGSFQGGGDDATSLIRLVSETAGMEEMPKGPWKNSYSLDTNLLLVLTPEKTDLVLDPLEAGLGKTKATGKVQVLMAETLQAKATLSVNTLNANDWMADEPETEEPFELPADVSADLDLEAETISYNGGTIQNAQFSGTLRDGRLAIENLAAMLPGNSDLRLTGTLSDRSGKPFLEAKVHLDARTLRDLAAWQQVDLSEFPSSRVNRLTFDGTVRYADPALEIKSATITLDSTRFAGAVTLDLDDPNFMVVNGSINSIDLDSYYPALLEKTEYETLAQRINGWQEALKPLTGYKATIDLKAERVKMAGANIHNIAFKGGINGNILEIGTLEVGSFEGTKISLNGQVGDIPGQMNFALNGRVSADSFNGFLTWAEMASPFDERVIPTGVIRASLSGAKTTARYDLNGDLSGIGFSFKGVAENLMGTPVIAADLRLSHDRTIEFIRKFSPEYFPAKTPLGPFSLTTAMKGDEGDFRFDNLTLILGPARFDGTLRYQDLAGRATYSGQISAQQVRLDDFMAPVEAGVVQASQGGERWSSDVWDVTMLRETDFNIAFSAGQVSFRTYTFMNPKVRLIGKGGVMTVEGFEAGLYGGALKVDATMDARDTPVFDIAMNLTGVATRDILKASSDIDRITGKTDFSGTFKGRGQSQKEVIQSLSGNVNLATTNGRIIGINMQRLSERLGTLNSLQALGGLISTTFEGGETPYRYIRSQAKITSGVIAFDQIESDVDATDVGGRGRVNLPSWAMDISGALRLKDYPNAPAIGFNMKGPIGVAQAKFDHAAFTAHLTQQFTNNLFQNLLGTKEQQQGTGTGGTTPPASGSGTGTSGSETGTQPPKEPTPEEQMLKGLFDLLGGEEEEEEGEGDDEGGG